MKNCLVLAGALAALLSFTAPAAAAPDPVDMVDPFIGTTYGGDTFPGPDYPFGMIQWGPDTATQPAGGGYEYMDQAITGFSLTHLSGPGCPVMNDFGILPMTGAIGNPRTASIPFTHVQEHASPGWYDVLLGQNMDLEVTMTSTLRSGLAAFRFPGGAPAHVLMNLGHSGTTVLAAHLQLTGDRRFEGSITGGGFCGMPGHYRVFVAGEFDTPFQGYGAWRGSSLTRSARSASGPDAGMWLDFGNAHRTVKLRVAISFTDLAGARNNLRAEATTWDVQAERRRAVAAWRAVLSHASIAGGTDAQQHAFWTALYHALLHPNVISDTDGRYPGFDGKIHTVPKGRREYGNWSGWDVYRTQLQLLGFLFPRETSDMVRSLLDAYDEMGWLPRWSLVNDETAVMNGDPAPSLIADAYFFGARDFDARKALRAMIHGATVNATAPGQGWYVERNDIGEYARLGYVDSHRQNSVSHVPNGASETLEYAISDYAIAAFARALGDTAAYRRFLARSGDWAHLFDRKTGLIEPRNARGAFVVLPATDEGQPGFQEGSAGQYTWVVPQDQNDLIRDAGGDAAARRRLDAFFSVLPEHDGDWSTPYIGLNNEPSFGSPFLYLSAHDPARTQSIVRLIETKYFDNAPGGEPGNDDLGAMSAMYVWETAGLYPQIPGSATLDIASPLFTRVMLRSEDGRRIVVDAPRARTDRPYVRSVRLNGAVWNRTWIAVPRSGNVHLTFDLASRSSSWGSARGDEPPSFSSGVQPPPLSTPSVATNAESEDPIDAARAAVSPFTVTYFDGTIVPFDTRTQVLGDSYTLGERVPDAVRLPGGEYALASIYTDSVVFVSMQRRTIVARVKTGANPDALAYAPQSGTLWVAERGAGAVLPIDAQTHRAGTPVRVGAGPLAVALGVKGRMLYVADGGANAVSIVDVLQGKEIARIAVGASPSALAVAPDGDLYVANTFSNDVSIIDPQSRRVIATVPVGVFPRSIAFAAGKAYIANWADSTVSIIGLQSRRVAAMIRTGDQPASLAASADGKRIFVADSGDNAVQWIDAASNRLSPETFTPGSSPRTIRGSARPAR